ncbi:MAG TPA: ferric reductase-like transmembrane domain-containing protein [Candidatus Bathyarchaeia archaeon]|nr:ferric reductase-like transmembrane domain-containing protein [Candidatus Bathyarchaeia archaeon]
MPSEIQIPWDWYVVRASALIGFLLLYIAVFAGTVSCLPGVRKYFLKLHSLNFHCWISLQALVFAFIHAISLLFHRFILFNFADILVPFHSSFEPVLTAYGTISLCLMIALVATSYLRKYISYALWRGIHFLNIALYAFSVIHAYYLGTDLKSGALREVFIWANVILILLLAYNVVYRLWSRLRKREVLCEIPAGNPYENIHQSDSAGGEK